MATRTFGVEEELLLVDPADGHPRPTGERVVRRAGERRDPNGTQRPLVEHEFKAEQAEIGSKPTASAAELTEDLRFLRRELARAASVTGVQIAALATSPTRVDPTVTAEPRYERMVDTFGLLARQQLTCGQHVHVSVDSRAEGVGVIDRIAVDLPLLIALSANSPFWQGEDTGYCSYRTVVWGLWPTAGPTTGFGDEAGYDAAIADLLASGAAMDDGMIYFDARLSAHYPTVEIRVADVCTDVDDAVLIAVLCRALVESAAAAWQAGEPAPRVRSELLKAATWRAARYGMTGELYDPLSRRAVPAAELLEQLIDRLTPELTTAGDLGLARAGLDRLRRTGSGCVAQREALLGGGGVHDVVLDAVGRTLR
jgi:carboxylate-amine ligase